MLLVEQSEDNRVISECEITPITVTDSSQIRLIPRMLVQGVSICVLLV